MHAIFSWPYNSWFIIYSFTVFVANPVINDTYQREKWKACRWTRLFLVSRALYYTFEICQVIVWSHCVWFGSNMDKHFSAYFKSFKATCYLLTGFLIYANCIYSNPSRYTFILNIYNCHLMQDKRVACCNRLYAQHCKLVCWGGGEREL